LLLAAAVVLLTVSVGIVMVGRVPTARSAHKRAAPNKPNVLFVCFDALRADHLSSYGYLRQTTPTIDRLAAEGTRFEWAISQAAFTMPSMISFFTGNTPLRHGVRDFLDVLPARSVTLAEILGDYGYTTAAFVSNNTLLREWGYDQGFATYDKSARFRFSSTQRSLLLFGLLARILPVGRGSDARSTTDAVMRWITRDPRQPFFMWLHYMDSHSPYEPPPPYDVLYDSTYTDHDRFQRLFGELKSKIEEIPDVDVRQYVNERDLSHLAALYDGETRFADDQFGRLVSLLRSRGVLDRTLVVVTADHGEALGDHNCLAHNYYLYDETQRIPLIMRYPALLPAGRPVGEQVRAIDVMPTILEILGIPSPGAIEGRSLLGLVLGTEQGLGLDAYAESRPHVRVVDAGLPGITGKRRMIRSEGYKLIYTPRFGDPLWELYDLKDDPLELRNVYAQYPDIAERLKGKLLALLKANENGAESALPGRVDEDTRQELKALGYIP
jgi:arylsulfatase A-like enzyme